MSELRTRHAQSDDSPGFLLWQVTTRWQAAVRSALKPLGLTHVQFVLLASLTYLQAAAPVSQRQLAEHAATDEMMTSQVVRALAARDLVRRERDPRDGRAVAVVVTPAGAELVNRAVAVVEDCDDAFFDGLGSELPHFVRQLTVLQKNQ